MAKLYVDTIEPEGATTNLAIGESGQNIIVTGNDIRANVLQDAGGNAIFTSNGSGTLSGVNSGFGDALVLIATQTADDSASLSFTSGIDSTYDEYIFMYFNIQPATNNAFFQFQCNAAGGSGYDETITSTLFLAYHNEASTAAVLTYTHDDGSDYDQASGTSYQQICTVGSASDNCASGKLTLFNPASTTYYKSFHSTSNVLNNTSYSRNMRLGGYFATTSALDEIQFKFSAGNITVGTIKMFGVK